MIDFVDTMPMRSERREMQRARRRRQARALRGLALRFGLALAVAILASVVF